ncbi:kinase-like domain-containing protein [Syncephalis plumigaleata]|nr:kinase-like domain-containing protein [Syncephalis plumigaleata]
MLFRNTLSTAWTVAWMTVLIAGPYSIHATPPPSSSSSSLLSSSSSPSNAPKLSSKLLEPLKAKGFEITNKLVDEEYTFVGKTWYSSWYSKSAAIIKCTNVKTHIDQEKYAFSIINKNNAAGKEYILNYYNEFSLNDAYCFVLEYVNGNTLDEYAKGLSPQVKRSELPGILKQILHGIIYLHNIGLAHMDIKPRNIMVYATLLGKKYVKIIDFDHAVPANKPTLTYGTVFYRPPESLAGVPVNPILYDIWSIGTTFYEAILDTKPFVMLYKEGDTVDTFTAKLKTLQALNFEAYLYPKSILYHLDYRLDDLFTNVKELMAFSPDKRPNLPAFLSALDSKL